MKRSMRASEPLSGSKTKKSGCSNLGCALFALPFLLAGAVFLYFFTVGPALKIYEAQSWSPTPCVVTSSSVASGGDDTYAVRIAYTYSVGGGEYHSDRYDFFSGYTSGYDGKAEVVRQNPAGKNAICYVNPANPADSVFNREFTSGMWIRTVRPSFLSRGRVRHLCCC